MLSDLLGKRYEYGAVFLGCTTRFVIDMVGNPKVDRFSRGVATFFEIDKMRVCFTAHVYQHRALNILK